MKYNEVFLPGLQNQVRFLQDNLKLENLDVLVIGTFSESIAVRFAVATKKTVHLIVPDFDSLLNANMLLDGDESVKVKIMDYERTDFEPNTFDLVYAQASISSENRRKILKEIKKILKPGGYLCVGEITSTNKALPVFLQEAYYSSGIQPIHGEELVKYYSDLGFEFMNSEDFSDTLREYYAKCKRKLNDSLDELKSNEQSYYKKILKRISHESNLFTRFNAEKYIGFTSMLLKRG